MGVVTETCIKCPGGITRITGTDMRMHGHVHNTLSGTERSRVIKTEQRTVKNKGGSQHGQIARGKSITPA